MHYRGLSVTLMCLNFFSLKWIYGDGLLLIHRLSLLMEAISKIAFRYQIKGISTRTHIFQIVVWVLCQSDERSGCV